MERHANKLLIAVGLLFIGLLSFSLGYVVRDSDIPTQEELELSCSLDETYHTFYEVMDLLVENHYSSPTRQELLEGAIDGMIESLDDPYTSYWDYEEARAFSERFGEVYVGIGVRVRYDDAGLIIEGVTSGSPADLAGIYVNDIITHINGEDIRGLNFYQIVERIIGEEGTSVVIGVYRQNVDETIYFDVIREQIENPSVTHTTYTKDGKTIGYIKVNTFGNDTNNLFQEAIVELEEQNIEGLIVDLRDNGGGYLHTVYFMMQKFLINDGTAMYYTEVFSNGVFSTVDYNSATTDKKPYEIVTLVNQNSASASEVFASAMQQHGGYLVVGQTTYGKGTMQTTLPLETTTADELHITVGKWLTADGIWVHTDGGTGGVVPDIEAEPTDMELAYKVFLFNGENILFDSVDDKTANVQVVLNGLGFDLRTDGYFDAATRDAIIWLQTEYNVNINGNLNEETLEVINSLLHDYQNNPDNDSILQAGIDALVNND